MTDILDNYARTVTATGNTPRDRSVFDRVQIFNETFMQAPEYEQIRVTNDSSNTTNYDSWIYSNSSYKELVSMKTIIFAPGTTSDIVFSGQYIRPQRQGGLFMLYSDDKQYENKLKGLMDECTETLRRYNDDGVLVEIPIILRSRSSGSLDEDKYMVLTDGSHQVGVPKTTETLKWEEGTTFILANRHKYRIAWIDDVKSDTYMEFRLQKYEENTERDNLQLGIADYEVRPNFTLETNIDTSQISIGNTVQIQSTLLDRDGQVSNKPLSYSSSDESICTVSDSGLITSVANGTCTITVSMTNNSSVTDSINMTVTASPVDNIVYSVSPDVNIIYRRQDESFTVVKTNNGNVVSETYTIVVDSSTTVNSDNYEFSLIGNNGYRIKFLGNDSGNIVVRITPNSDVGAAFNKSYTVSNSYG